MSKRTWLWMVLHERDGWASHTKFQRLVAFILVTSAVGFYVIRGDIPSLMPELLGVYLAYAVLGRASSKWIENENNKKEGEE